GEIQNCTRVEQQGLSSFNGDYAQLCFRSDAHCLNTYDGYIETHVLIRFGDFDHHCTLTRKHTAAFDGLVCSFQSFNGENGSILNDNCLPNVEARDFLRDSPTKIDILLFATRQFLARNKSRGRE